MDEPDTVGVRQQTTDEKSEQHSFVTDRSNQFLEIIFFNATCSARVLDNATEGEFVLESRGPLEHDKRSHVLV